MATTQSLTTTYAGEYAGRYIKAALLSPGSIENGAVSAQDGIKHKWIVPKMALSGIVGNATCDFTPRGTVTVTERSLITEDFDVNVKLCKKDHRKGWESLSMGLTNHDNLPPTFQDFLIEYVVASVAQHIEQTIWDGVNANDGEFDGFETLLASNADQPSGFEVAGTTVTAANVIAEIQKVLDATSSALYQTDGFFIGIPVGIQKHYIAAQAALGYRDLYHDGKTNLNFQGVPLIVCPGLTDDKMIATYQNNLWLGFASEGDQSEVRVIDQADVDGSDNVHIVMKFNAGAQFGIGADIVTYGITNSAN